ncbi:MAG: hypothetical protein J6V98_06850 [Bacteroidales bacterium]|nr:hypothetical protein [Bacteroidales bacterium]
MKSIHNIFKQSVRQVTHYYMLLVEETKSQRLVGSTNEWVLDNYYMISEQEKVLRNELRSIGKGEWRVERARLQQMWDLLANYLKRCHYEVDKALLFRYLAQVQQREKDYLSYPEVTALLPLCKLLLIHELATLCGELEREQAYRYSPTDKARFGAARLEQAARQNLQMMNIFNSLRKMTRLPMAELVDAVSFSEKTLKAERAGMYDQMYDRTKDDYRNRIVRLSRKQKNDKRKTEYDLVKMLVRQADERGEHVGWQLFPPKKWSARAHSYVWIVVLASLALSVTIASVAGYGVPAPKGNYGTNWIVFGVMALLLWVPMSQVVIDLFNWLLGKLHKPVNTFKIKFKDGLIPKEYTTMVIMPTILKNKAKTLELLEQLEVYYLSNINRASGAESDLKGGNRAFQRLESRPQNLYYTLIGDAAAYKEADAPWDQEVVDAGLQKVKELNEKYGVPIFNFVYRRRAWSEGEQTWLGHERKRGAILHFNDLVLGQTSEADKQKRFRCETISAWLKSVVSCQLSADSNMQGGGSPTYNRQLTTDNSPIKFIITLDTDTELVLYSAQKLIGAMAHPLNRAQLSPDGRRVDSGYGIMQPRVNVDVEVTNKSRYAQLMAGLGGLDVYTTASFELYQDIFNEGSFCGKGIYDLRVFQQVLKGTFPENLILSHDLLEGCHIRCGLINDVELFDDNPSNYIDDAKRHHRWTRGDWQIIGWLKDTVRNERGERVKNQVNTIGRWKIFDNLRRSVLSLALMLTIFAGYTLSLLTSHLSPLNPACYVLIALVAVASPIVFFIIGQITTLPRFGKRYRYYMTLMRGFKVILYRSMVQFALLPKEAWMYTDAAVRACYRMWFSHRDLLAWITSDEAARSTKGTMGDYLGKFWFNYVASAALILLCLFSVHTSTASAAFTTGATLFCVLLWCGAPLLMYRLGRKFPQDRHTLNAKETDEVRRLAKDTWHFFDTLITPDTHYLIPDNYQLGREPLTDYKTSPTNIGYSLTAVVSAARLGYITDDEAVRRLEHIVDTVTRLEKWNGHLFNWYDIHSLKALPNYFISTCDSGNFVACLHVVKGWLAQSATPTAQSETADTHPAMLAARVQRLIDETDFTKLYNPELDVFSIGYDHGAHCLLPYHYNNYASEARLTSFLTIAQGDAPYKHWFCLDKTLVQYRGYKGVASWYGTLFEYFMPLIFLPTYRHTLMDETYSFALRAQRAFVKNAKPQKQTQKLPWGISETAYNELDDAQNYKYHAFGVPYLKFQNTTPDRIVVSPYSSLMTIGVDDRAVYENMCRFRSMGMYDEFGFYESYDAEDHVAVRAHYAHHQGMILASLANYLCDHCLQHYFMQAPVMRSMETLLKEKAQVKPYIDLKVTKYKRYQYSKVQTESDAREYDGVANVPEIGVVSNGEYTVMLNDRGSGFSRYRNILINRYRKVSADHYGCYLFIRNLRDDRLWSATYAPLDVLPDGYRVSFASDKIGFLRRDGGIETQTEITVLKDHMAELRRYTFTNNTNEDVELELTTYGEVVLSPRGEDESHRVFNAMKIRSEYDAGHQALVFSRPASAGVHHYVLHKLWIEGTETEEQDTDNRVEYETSRLKFLGRGGSLAHADIIESHRTLTGTVGTTLDPVMSMRRRVLVPAGKEVEVYVMTAFAKSKEQLLHVVEQYRSAMDVNYAFETASVFNNMRTSMSTLKGVHMRLYNNIAKYIGQTATLGNDRPQLLAQNTLSQSGLWRFGISGDLAIVLMEVDSMAKSGFAKEMLRAFEYYKVHGMMLDLVIINDAVGDEHDSLTHFIRNMADTEHLWSTHSVAGKVYVLDGSDVSREERVLLRTVARLVFDTGEGLTIEQQLERLEAANQHYQDKIEYPALRPKREFRVWSSLDYYNQYGGFDREGRDYVVTNTNTPMPWVNVIANPQFGCVVSSTMSGFTFARNAQQFKLTGWSNDMVRDSASEMLLIGRRQFVPATARHSQGWSAFDAEYDDLKVNVRVFVAVERMEKYYQIRLENKLDRPQEVQLDMVYKLVLGDSEERTARYLYSEWDEASNTLRVRNVYHPVYRDSWVLLSATEPLTDVSLNYPNRKRLGLTVDIAAQSEKELAFVMAVSDGGYTPQSTIKNINEEYDRVVAFWDDRLTHIQVETPDRSFNYMLNRWYLYQVYSSRLFARAGFYQVGGATGFRDQLQDVMSLLYRDPAYARRQILDHAAHQFAEGDVLHWWHESMKMGARTTFSDDYLWLVFVTYQYVKVTGDTSILNEQVPFCQAEQLRPDEAERGVNYTVGSDSVSLYEHLRRSMNRAMSRIGAHGLPLMGCGDWNDGMSSVGVGGKGESVWVAFFLADLLPKMEQLTQMTPGADLSYCEELSAFRRGLVDAIQRSAWDGAWFLRAWYDNGDPMGSRNSVECQIDLICQAWSILTDVATPEQKASIMRETDRRLVNREHEIIQLLTPAFRNSNPSPGYIMNYPEGVRENGGQYTHGAMWYIMAKLKEGRIDEAYYLYSLINPVHRTQTLADVLKYKVEPYCIAADIYSNPQHPGRGGWTWYTGSASWAYKTGIENILGFRKEGDRLTIDPHIPSEWQGYTLRYRHGSSTYVIKVTSGQAVIPTVIDLVDDGQVHEIEIGK